MNRFLTLFIVFNVFGFFQLQAQILIDNAAPYNNHVYLIDDVYWEVE